MQNKKTLANLVESLFNRMSSYHHMGSSGMVASICRSISLVEVTLSLKNPNFDVKYLYSISVQKVHVF